MSTVEARATGVSPINWKREWLPLAALLLFSMLIRLPYRSHNLFIGDSINYAYGALKTGVAHPPGYVGYCVLGRVLNGLFHNINTTFVWISFVSTAVALVLVYAAARWFGLGARPALVATALFSFSINVLYFSVVALNHSIDAMDVLAFVVMALIAIRKRSMGWALAASAMMALTGAIRPTSVGFCALLWLYVIIRAKPRERGWAGYLAAHAAIAAPILAVWLYANAVLMERAGYGGKTFDLQVMMPSAYEYASLTGDVKQGTVAAPSYHMPAFEILSWLDRRVLHSNMLPHESNWPEPSIVRAIKLVVVQTGKLTYFLLFSAPLALVLPVLVVVRRRNLKAIGRTNGLLLLLWMGPAILFFMFGHLGSIGYVQTFLAGLIILLCLLIFGRAG